MKPETLDALLLDRAMGELPPEVAELLEAHLARHPEAARQAEKLASTLQLARQAMRIADELPRRSLAVTRLRQAQARWRRRSMAWGWARLAACVVIGLALGWQGHALRQNPVTAVARPASAGAAPAIAATVPRDTGDFWSQASMVAAIKERAPAESRSGTRYRLHWESPVKAPRVEEDL
ncbi:MAG TPA: hypothetical protein VLW52_00890 [Opitutaceae bacterium]|nr:hypothetical protein [Opitutaceae bacterium]